MFYDRFKQLCDLKKVSCNRAASEIGLSNATPTKWKKTGATPSGETLERIAAYFGVTTDYLLGTDEKRGSSGSGEPIISDSDIKFALFGGRNDVTDAMYEEVKQFAQFVLQRGSRQEP